MDPKLTARKAKLLELFQCAICHDGVKDTEVCFFCSRIYCSKCIHGWLEKSRTCPNCRSSIDWKSMTKVRSINELQESLTQFLSSLDADLCGQHKQRLTLFCYYCEENICVSCLFETEDHLDHKERVVIIGEAYKHFKSTLTNAMVWTIDRQDFILERLETFAEHQRQLNSENEQIKQLHDEANKLLTREGSSSAITEIRNVVGKIKELRLKDQRDTDAIRIDRRGDFMLEPVVVVFCMPEFSKMTPVEGKYQVNSRDSNGFEWKCTISNRISDDDSGDSGGDNENEEKKDAEYCFDLSLIEGLPSDYSISFGNEPELVISFVLNKPVLIGFLPSQFENDTCRVTVEIRQTFEDKIQLLQERNQQLQARIAQLEEQCAKQKSSSS